MYPFIYTQQLRKIAGTGCTVEVDRIPAAGAVEMSEVADVDGTTGTVGWLNWRASFRFLET